MLKTIVYILILYLTLDEISRLHEQGKSPQPVLERAARSPLALARLEHGLYHCCNRSIQAAAYCLYSFIYPFFMVSRAAYQALSEMACTR